MELCVALEPGHFEGRRVRFEAWLPGRREAGAWAPGRERVWGFTAEGAPCGPYEAAGLDLCVPPPAPPPGGEALEVVLIVNGVKKGPVLPFSTEYCLRLYADLPTSDEDARCIPHHLADGVLTLAAPYATALYAHADNGWCDVQTYAHASLGEKPLSDDALYTPVKEALKVPLVQVFSASILPDVEWLLEHRERFAPSAQRLALTPSSQGMGGLPLYGDAEVSELLPDAQERRLFQENGGLTAAATWRADRGRGAEFLTPEWVRARMLEVLHLRGRRSREAWLAHGDRLGPYPETHEAEFVAVVNAMLLGGDPVAPMGSHAHQAVIHDWAREAIEDVFAALGSHAVTRRYVYDHRWVHGVYNARTDENTLSWKIPGDCEDSNSTVYYAVLYMLKTLFGGDALLQAMQVCLMVSGVPVCVAGTSQAPKDGGEDEAPGAHLFGFSIPHREYARAMWNLGEADEANVLGQLNAHLARLGVRGRVGERVFRAATPQVYETIAFTSSAYLDRVLWPRDHHAERFAEYLRVVKAAGDDAVFPHVMGAPYALALPHEGRVQLGYVVHGRPTRVLTAATPLCFTAAFRLQFAKRTLCLQPGSSADDALDRTFAFVPHLGDEASVLTTELHLGGRWRLVSCTRVSKATQDAEYKLLAYDCPAVPMRDHAAPWAAEFRAMLAKAGVPTADGVAAASERDRFVAFVYADALAEGLHMAKDLAAAWPDAELSVQPYGWSVACVFSFV